VRLDPGSAERRRTAEQLGGALKALPALAAAYAETLAALPFGPAYVGLALALAALQDEKLNQLEAAEKTLGELLAHDPSHAGALDALVQMYERRGLHERRAKALEQKLEFTADAATRKQLLLTLAELHETWLKQPGPAAYALRRLLELEPSVANARLLVALHRRHQAWSDVLDALLQVRGLSARDQRAAVQLEIAALHERELKDLDTAIAAYQEALELDAKSSEAFRGLERLYLQLDRRGELLHAYERRLAQKLADEEAIELHFKLAALWEERGNPLNADQALVAVLKLDASQLRALEGLARLRRAMARWRPLTETLARTVLVVTEPAKLAALCTEAGQVHLEHLREPAAAERWWNQALAHVAEHRPALEALVELQLTHARWQDGLKYLARLVQLERDPSARAALEFRAGAVHEERLKDLPAARAAWQRALKSDPVHLPSLRRLRALFRQAGEWREYEANLAQEATHAPSPVDRCAAAVELAAHLEKRAGHEVDAVPWYEHALAARPEALEAALPLCDLLIFAERWPRAAEVLKRAVSLLEHEAKQRPAERINRLCQLARAQRELDQPQLALETYAHALQLDSVNAAALRGQVDVLVQLGQLEEATRKLELFDERHGLSLPRAQRAVTRLERA
jgi:tetratricopeptide (TPR) repeat protein